MNLRLKKALTLCALTCLACWPVAIQAELSDVQGPPPEPAVEAARLEAELAGVEGRERLRLMADLVAIYRRIEPHRALEHGDEIQGLLVRQALTPQVEGRLLTDLSDSAYITGDKDFALHWAYFALRAARQAEYDWGRAQALWRMARIHGSELSFEAAMQALEEVQSIARELQSPELLSAYYSTLALVQDYHGHTLDFREALYESLQQARKGSDEFQLGLALLNMGFDYSNQQKPDAAAGYLQEALGIFRRRGDIFYIAATMEVLAGALHAQGKSGEALMTVTEAQRLAEKLGQSEVIGRALLQLAEIQHDLGLSESALENVERCLDLWRRTESETWLGAGLGRKGEYLLSLGRPQEALRILQESQEILQRLERKQDLLSTIETMARAYEALGRPREALATYRRFGELRAEQAEERSQGNIDELQARFESAEKDRAIADLELTRVLDSSKLAYERGWRRVLLASAALLLGTVLAIGLAYSTQRRGRVELQQAYGRLDKAHQALEAHSAEIRELVREKEELFALAAHDLRAPVVSIRGVSQELQADLRQVPGALEALASARARIEAPIEARIEAPIEAPAEALIGAGEEERQRLLQLVADDMPEELEKIREATGRLETLVDGLLKLYRLSRNEMEATRIDTTELVERVVASYSFEIEQARAVVRVAKLPVVLADRTALETVFGNLLHNAIKYLDPERPAEIEVSCERRRGETVFHVHDNGRGIAADDLERVFKVFARVGALDKAGEGIGLAAARTLVRRHGGFLWCTSRQGEGSTFSFSLPDEPRHATIAIPRPQRPDTGSAEVRSGAG